MNASGGSHPGAGGHAGRGRAGAELPGPGEVLVRPEAVGICGSDFHYFLGDIGAVEESQRFPRIQGHEASGIIEEGGPIAHHTSGRASGSRCSLTPRAGNATRARSAAAMRA